MKRFISVLTVCLILILTFCSCNNNEAVNNVETTIETIPQETQRLQEDWRSIEKLAVVEYPTSNDEWEYTVYSDSTGTYDKFVMITGCKIESSDISIPKELEGYPVLSVETLDPNTFVRTDETSILSVANIPEGVLCIGRGAFSYFGVEKIQIPNTVQYIESGAFSHCERLKEVELPNSVKYLNPYAFDDCKSLEKVIIPHSVKEIGEAAYAAMGGSFGNANTVVYGEAGSEAARWCAENKIKFRVIE